MQHTMVHVCICLECLYPGRPLCIFLSCDSPFSFAGSELFPQVDVQDSRSLVSLPVDALGEILARVESLADVRCLTRSCKAFLACSRSEHVQAAWLMAHCPVSSSCPGPRPCCPTTQHIGGVSDCRWVVKGIDRGLHVGASSSIFKLILLKQSMLQHSDIHHYLLTHKDTGKRQMLSGTLSVGQVPVHSKHL
jgi:hypothetical protein